MRGRGRRGPSPISRSYESNGPDVKVRGTPAHIAEKYMQLARDAHASGDPVLAESYLQHAEHYFRIIAAAQSQNQQPGEGPPPHRYNGGGRFDSAEDEGDEAERQDNRSAGGDSGDDASPAKAETQPQPEEQPAPAPRRRRRRGTNEQAAASGNGADSSSSTKANGDGGQAGEQSDGRSESAGTEDVNA